MPPPSLFRFAFVVFAASVTYNELLVYGSLFFYTPPLTKGPTESGYLCCLRHYWHNYYQYLRI